MDLSWIAAAVGTLGGLSAWAFAVMRERDFMARTKHLARELARQHGQITAALSGSHLQDTLRLQYAQWWANNAAESNTSEGLRFTLLELALYALASESMDEVREMLINRVAKEPDPERVNVLRDALGELDFKHPRTGEPWHPWQRHERRGDPDYAGVLVPHHSPEVMRWWRTVLERGAYTSRVRVFELAVDVYAAISQEGQRAKFEPRGAWPGAGELLALLAHRRIVSNSRPLPVYGENLQ